MFALRLIPDELPARMLLALERRARSKVFSHARAEEPPQEDAEGQPLPTPDAGEGHNTELQVRVEDARRWMRDLRGSRRQSDQGQA